MDKILTPEFWEKKWLEFREKNSFQPYRKEEQAHIWNKRAASYSCPNKEDSASRVNLTWQFLTQYNVLGTGMNVLDIGCGPGTLTLPLAKLGINVVALDPAEKMLEQLLKQIPSPCPGKIEIVNALWEDIDIVKAGWLNKFDLVLASMSPGISDLKAIEKMIWCSRNWCFMSGFSGVKQFELNNEIWLHFLQQPYSERFNDIIFPFNLIYALGYRPSLTFNTFTISSRERLEDYVGKISSDLAQSITLTAEIEKELQEIVYSRSTEGWIEQQVNMTVGMFLWQINDKQIASGS